MVRKIITGGLGAVFVGVIFFLGFLWRLETRLPEGVSLGTLRVEELMTMKVARKERTEKTSVLVRIRNRFSEAVFLVMPEEEGRLGVGYLLGMKEGLSKEVKEELALVGLSHIVVASGAHLGIIVGFFKEKFGKISRFAGMLFSVVIVFLFGMMIGWTPSITRAAIVAIISLLVWYVGGKPAAGRVIGIAIMATLIIEPLYLFDLGWQLSFLAFFGILVLAPMILEFFYGAEQPWLARQERRGVEAGAITKTVIASCAATVMVTPVLVYNFGSFSLVSVIANVLILPTMAGVMGLVFAAGCFELIGAGVCSVFSSVLFGSIAAIGRGIEFFGEVVGKIATWAIGYHLVVIRFFAERKEFIVQGFKGDWRVLLVYIPIFLLVIVGTFLRAQKRRKVTARIRENPGKYLRWGRPAKTS